MARRKPGPERPAVLPRALRLAGDRAEVPGDVRAAHERQPRPGHASAARLARAAQRGLSAGCGCPCRPRRGTIAFERVDAAAVTDDDAANAGQPVCGRTALFAAPSAATA